MSAFHWVSHQIFPSIHFQGAVPRLLNTTINSISVAVKKLPELIHWSISQEPRILKGSTYRPGFFFSVWPKGCHQNDVEYFSNADSLGQARIVKFTSQRRELSNLHFNKLPGSVSFTPKSHWESHFPALSWTCVLLPCLLWNKQKECQYKQKHSFL